MAAVCSSFLYMEWNYCALQSETVMSASVVSDRTGGSVASEMIVWCFVSIIDFFWEGCENIYKETKKRSSSKWAMALASGSGICFDTIKSKMRVVGVCFEKTLDLLPVFYIHCLGYKVSSHDSIIQALLVLFNFH